MKENATKLPFTIVPSSLDRANPLYQENALQYSLSHTLILGSLGDGLLELRELLPDAEKGPHANAHTRRTTPTRTCTHAEAKAHTHTHRQTQYIYIHRHTCINKNKHTKTQSTAPDVHQVRSQSLQQASKACAVLRVCCNKHRSTLRGVGMHVLWRACTPAREH